MMMLDWTAITAAAVVLFFIVDPFGNIPVFNALLKAQPPRQRALTLLRESVIGLIILGLFTIGGEKVMKTLGLSASSLNIAGGTLLLVIAIQMVFPGRRQLNEEEEFEDPMIVPIAIPMIAGPSAMAVVMVQSSGSHLGLAGTLVALLMAWGLSTMIVVASPYFVDRLGTRFVRALERLMGMLLLLLAVQMLLNGIANYVDTVFFAAAVR